MPREGHDLRARQAHAGKHDFYPRAPGGARHVVMSRGNPKIFISTHVPREGHDPAPAATRYVTTTFLPTCPARGTTSETSICLPMVRNFYPRAPRGARLRARCAAARQKTFLSTCPARGTTIYTAFYPLQCPEFLSTCPARGTTLVRHGRAAHLAISIRVPREGHDHLDTQYRKRWILFLSACPARGTTYRCSATSTRDFISIRVPREGHDAGDAEGQGF